MKMLLQNQFAKMLLISSLSVLLLILSVNSTVVNQYRSIGDSFKQCLISPPTTTLGQCLGVEAIKNLENLDNNPEFDLIDGVTLLKGAQEYREAYNFADRDPSNFRSIVESLGQVLAARSMRWDLSFLYPGLTMNIAPSTSPGGVLEFLLDPRREALNLHSLKEASTGRLLARQFLVPLLLGFKFNISTIIPILFGILALLAKKAVLISKFALILSSAFGLGVLLFGNGNKVQQQYQGTHFNPGFGGNGYKYPEDEYEQVYYRGIATQSNDQLRLYSNIPEAFDRTEKGEQTKGRNFVWSEDEKTKEKL